MDHLIDTIDRFERQAERIYHIRERISKRENGGKS
jgi:hypothetical protein